ncbi:MAG: prolipoprotein diacylglyceryl transferase [Myxococcales bacterium]|jgi:phosphatidylglycerol:prolipoprotein diacylglycerol transferase
MTGVLLIPWFRWEAITVPVSDRQLTVYPYQITVALAIVVIISSAAWFAHKHGRSVERLLDFLIYIMAFALPVALVFATILDQPGAFTRIARDPGSLGDLRLHWSTLGGLIGGFTGALVWAWRKNGFLFEMLDTLAFALPFGWCIARIGCFGVHDHAGRVSNFPLAVAEFHFGTPPYQPRHDMALYDAIVVGVIAIGFAFLSRSPRPTGFYLGTLLVAYTPIRFLLDFLRAPAFEGGMARHLGLTHVQYIAAALLVVGWLVLRRVYREA